MEIFKVFHIEELGLAISRILLCLGTSLGTSQVLVRSPSAPFVNSALKLPLSPG